MRRIAFLCGSQVQCSSLSGCEGCYLEIDLAITLYRETKGDIRPFAKFVISILRQNDFL